MRSGVISDFTATKAIVRVLLYKVCKNMVFKPNIVVCMPSTVTNLEKRTILDLVTAAGAGRACLIEEPLAAALGAGLDISRPMGTMVIDIGGGTADIAVVTMGSISISKSVKIAGNILDEDIIRYLRRERNIVIGEKTAGRADVQETFELSDGGAIVLTTSKMLPYISDSFDGNGLTPDTEIILADSLRENLSTLEKDRDTQLQAAVSMLAGNSAEE